MATHSRSIPVVALLAVAASLGGCATSAGLGGGRQLSERECMARVMYFESNRSSDDGMLAVGSVVMNRLQSPRYPKTVCAVVDQHNQFADGALSKPIERRSQSWARAERAADAVLAGARHDGVGAAMFFHTAGHTFPYRNMKYVTLAGGNVFYEKQRPGTFTPGMPWERDRTPTMLAAAEGETGTRAVVPKPAPSAYAHARPAVPATVASNSDNSRPAPVRLASGPRTPPSAGRASGSRTDHASASTKPKGIVLAMLSEPKHRGAGGPISITDLIELDRKRR